MCSLLCVCLTDDRLTDQLTSRIKHCILHGHTILDVAVSGNSKLEAVCFICRGRPVLKKVPR